MKYAILPNGNLEITLDSTDDREEIAEWRGVEWWEMFGAFGLGLQGNGWTSVEPEWIGALTDAPIVTDDFTLDDAGKYEVNGRVWWFPNYMMEDPVETLLEKGAVVFTCAPPG